MARYVFISDVAANDPGAILDVENELQPYPTRRERRWVKVGWPTETKGALWVANFEHRWPATDHGDNVVPENAGRVALARDMDEHCKIIEKIGGKYFKNIEEYVGETFLRAWEWKQEGEGEVGPMARTVLEIE